MNIASIDIGTNTVLLLIANIKNNELNSKNKNSPSVFIKPILNKYSMPRLGKGLIPGGNILQESIDRFTDVLEDYRRTIDEYGCTHILARATNAMRIASNTTEIVKTVKDRYSIEIEVIPGSLEASLTYLGAASSASSDSVLLIDIGGGSTEISIGNGDNILFSRSFQIGAVSLTEKYRKNKIVSIEEENQIKRKIIEVFSPLKEMMSGIDKNIVTEAEATAVAGTPITAAAINLELKEFSEAMLEGYRLNVSDLRSVIDKVAATDAEKMPQIFGNVIQGREDILYAGMSILEYILRFFNKDKVTVSTRGLRHGIILDFMQNNSL